MQATRYFSLLFGAVFLVLGIVGFIPAFHTTPPPGAPHLAQSASYGYLFGVFPINAWHNVINIVVGLAGMVAGASFSLARGYCVLIFFLFGVLAIMGFLPEANTFWGWVPLFSGDTWLHAAASLAAGLVGYVAAEPASVEPAPLPATPAH